MICPKCRSTRVQPISRESAKYYCVDCNYAWDIQNNAQEPEGTLTFNGIPQAQQVFDILTKGQEFTPEFKAAMESQIVAIIFNEWFEGFKCGQMASILYAKEYNSKLYENQYKEKTDGKNRNELRGTASSCEGDSRKTSRVGENRRHRQLEDPANPRARKNSAPVTERVGEKILRYPRNIKCPEQVFETVARFNEIGAGLVESYYYDGTKLTAELR